ncbi:MAG: peptide deformylase [Erysipelotrichaceae bacterium]|nr:peptide deformylase [Erysipelotrichaceae bacterium]
MIRPIVRDHFLLSKIASPATKADLPIAQDLRDTLSAHRNNCVGMAANMIGFPKRIIIVSLGFFDLVMLNPVITEKKDSYKAEEGCLSLAGQRITMRYQRISVRYQDEEMKWHTQEFSGQIAQIVQHECDHLEGILI